MAPTEMIQRQHYQKQRQERQREQLQQQQTSIEELPDVTEDNYEQNAREDEETSEHIDEFHDDIIGERFYRESINILLWDKPLWTAGSFTLIQLVIFALENNSFTSLFAYTGLIVLFVSTFIKITGIQLEPGHPLHSLLYADTNFTESELDVLTRHLKDLMNNTSQELRRLFFWETMIPSFKLLLSICFLCLVGSWLDMRVVTTIPFTLGLGLKVLRFVKRTEGGDIQAVSGKTLLREHKNIIEIRRATDTNAVELLPINSFKQYNEAVMKDGRLVVVCCTAEWCQACKAATPQVTALVSDYRNRVTFYTIDVDLNHECSQILGISALPTFLVYKGRRELCRIIGDVEELDEEIGACLVRDSSFLY